MTRCCAAPKRARTSSWLSTGARYRTESDPATRTYFGGWLGPALRSEWRSASARRAWPVRKPGKARPTRPRGFRTRSTGGCARRIPQSFVKRGESSTARGMPVRVTSSLRRELMELQWRLREVKGIHQVVGARIFLAETRQPEHLFAEV